MAKKTVRGSFKRFIDVGSWLGVEEIKRNTGNLKDLATSLFTVDKPERKESFEEAMRRYNLKNSDIEERKEQFFRVAMLYLFIFFCMLLYALYLYLHGLYRPTFMALAFACVLFSMFFREHFWYTQLKHKRLGFTFTEWVLSIFK